METNKHWHVSNKLEAAITHHTFLFLWLNIKQNDEYYVNKSLNHVAYKNQVALLYQQNYSHLEVPLDGCRPWL